MHKYAMSQPKYKKCFIISNLPVNCNCNDWNWRHVCSHTWKSLHHPEEIYIYHGSSVLFNLHFWMISGNTFLQGDLIENWVKIDTSLVMMTEIVHDVSFYSRVLHDIALCCMILHGTLANSRIVHLVIMLSNIHDWYWI